MDNIPTWIAISSSVCLGLLVAIVTQFVIAPMQKRKIAKNLRAKNPVKFNIESSVGKKERDRERETFIFIKFALFY